MIEYIDQLKANGLLEQGLALGVIPVHIIGWYGIYLKYKAYVVAGQIKSDAVLYTAIDCRISQNTVWKIIRTLEKDRKIKVKVS